MAIAEAVASLDRAGRGGGNGDDDDGGGDESHNMESKRTINNGVRIAPPEWECDYCHIRCHTHAECYAHEMDAHLEQIQYDMATRVRQQIMIFL